MQEIPGSTTQDEAMRREGTEETESHCLAARRIRRLPHHVIDLIKAGEVIERPSSVVKELFENSVDAGATDIHVELLDGGRALIRVSDTGEGIPPEDVPLALERHATSKLATHDDLLEIGTFGFRGEALASIAAVGNFSIRSRVASEDLAVEVTVSEGVAGEPRRVAAPVGTAVTLKDLFSSVPARQKFLKSTITEFSHVQDYLLAMAVAYPRVGVRLTHNGRDVFRYAPAADLQARFETMQRELAREFVRFHYERGGFRVEGFAGLPETARPMPRLFLTFVNGRLVKDRVVRSGVLQAYSGLVLKGLLPSIVVFVSLDPAKVDVNAHPAKTEVRFQDPLALEDLVTIGIQSALKEHVSRRMLRAPDSPAGAGVVAASTQGGEKIERSFRAAENVLEKAMPGLASGEAEPRPRSAFRFPSNPHPDLAAQSLPRSAPKAMPKFAEQSAPQSLAQSPSAFAPARHQSPVPSGSTGSGGGEELFGAGAGSGAERTDRVRPAARLAPRGPFADARYLGQYLDCYLLFQAERDLLVVDQHAFHERVLYEELARATDTGRPPQQELLAPVLVPVPPSVASLVGEQGAALEKLGFRVEVLADAGVAVHAFPAFLPAGRVAEVFEEVLARIVALSDLPESGVHPFLLRAKGTREEFASLSVHERSLEAKSVYHLLHATMACHAAVRAGDPLNEELVRRLVNRSGDVDFFAHCPHGRPVYRRLTQKDVAEWFLRI